MDGLTLLAEVRDALVRLESHAIAQTSTLEALRDHLAPTRVSFVDTVTCTVANTIYTSKISDTLGRPATRGFVRVKSTATGTVQVRFITEKGQSATDWFTEITPGEGISFDGMTVAQVEVKSATAGDIVQVMAGA